MNIFQITSVILLRASSMGISKQQIAELVRKGWLPVNGENALFINETLFRKGIISLLDPSNYEASKIEENGPSAVSKERSIIFLKDDTGSRKAKQFFNLPATTLSLRNTNRRDECYVPVIVANEQGKAAAGLYINPRKVGKDDLQIMSKPFTAFHTETCLLGSQLSCRTNKGSIRHFTKHNVEFFEGERIVAITSSPGDNSYEAMQFEELQLMAIVMATYSLKGSDKKPKAHVTHHLPWLDYILSGALLWYQGHMTYPALRTLCEMMISKKMEHEDKIGTIYRSLGLTIRFITPFDNLLNPEKGITAESILEQLGVEEIEGEAQQKEPDLELITKLCDILKSNSDYKQRFLGDTMFESNLLQQLSDDIQKGKVEKRKLREKAFIDKYIMLLTENTFNTEQKDWWEKIITTKKSSGKEIETLEDLLEMANALALAIAASHAPPDPDSSNACSFVSTQAKQIQVVYEKLFKIEEIKLPPVTCWTSLPLFLTNSESTLGATFYFEYLAHAATISRLIEHNILGGAIANMVAWANGQKGKSVKCYLDNHTNTTPFHLFFRPIAEEVVAEVVAMPGVKTFGQIPEMFFQINGLSEYVPEIDDEPIIIGDEKRQQEDFPLDILEFGRKWTTL